MAGAFWNWSHDIQEDGVDVFLYDKAQNIIQVLFVARRAESWRANNTTMIQQNLLASSKLLQAPAAAYQGTCHVGSYHHRVFFKSSSTSQMSWNSSAFSSKS